MTNRAALRARCEAYALDVTATLTADPAVGNRALRGLLGERRMRVLADPDRLFRVEGVFDVDLSSVGRGEVRDPGAIRTRDPQLRRLVLYPG